jgi:hypothetical protein
MQPYKQQNLTTLEEDDFMPKRDEAVAVLECSSVSLLGRIYKKIKITKDLLKASSVVAGPRISYFCSEIWFS